MLGTTSFLNDFTRLIRFKNPKTPIPVAIGIRIGVDVHMISVSLKGLDITTTGNAHGCNELALQAK